MGNHLRFKVTVYYLYDCKAPETFTCDGIELKQYSYSAPYYCFWSTMHSETVEHHINVEDVDHLDVTTI